MNNCVYCASTTDLNTQLTITLEDGSKVTVSICDEHAEEASVKTARDAYMEKSKKINDLIQQARELGLNISESPSGITIAQKQMSDDQPKQGLTIEPQQSQPQQTKQPSPPQQQSQSAKDRAFEEWDDAIPTDKLDNHPGMRSVGGQTSGTMVESFNSYDYNMHDKLDPEARKGKAKLEVFEGREGQPIALPSVRKDGTGTTTVRVVKGESDKTLQERFKRMSMDEDVSFSSGYSTRDCPFCRGNCEVNGKTCPKCKGSGIISIH